MHPRCTPPLAGANIPLILSLSKDEGSSQTPALAPVAAHGGHAVAAAEFLVAGGLVDPKGRLVVELDLQRDRDGAEIAGGLFGQRRQLRPGPAAGRRLDEDIDEVAHLRSDADPQSEEADLAAGRVDQVEGGVVGLVQPFLPPFQRVERMLGVRIDQREVVGRDQQPGERCQVEGHIGAKGEVGHERLHGGVVREDGRAPRTDQPPFQPPARPKPAARSVPQAVRPLRRHPRA
ncbi:hypothetical protein SI859A1_02402 [Aurantimonas manganoxydans SI85-9A1]|uniref:Uncharacterized protein n=1 Tax=Aurantimonas manganoxydans (strain ATCC BAA-1229 / DSM 21871 / SI85-9A1) TaxID=287752 RepID=Q1YLZ5_AURMS|nr:hypothetical protein SI859A1_02402 [Aurantimonas manganoxydans SI85-9A1]